MIIYIITYIYNHIYIYMFAIRKWMSSPWSTGALDAGSRLGPHLSGVLWTGGVGFGHGGVGFPQGKSSLFDGFLQIWRFANGWGYPSFSSIDGIFHEINHPFWGTPYFQRNSIWFDHVVGLWQFSIMIVSD